MNLKSIEKAAKKLGWEVIAVHKHDETEASVMLHRGERAVFPDAPFTVHRFRDVSNVKGRFSEWGHLYSGVYDLTEEEADTIMVDRM